MEEILLTLMINWKVNLFLIAGNVILYLVNYFLFKLKREYKGFHYQMFLVMLLPCLNVIFLIFNSLLFITYGSGFRVVKPRRKVRTRTGRTVKA